MRPTHGLSTRAPTHASWTNAARYAATAATSGLGNFSTTSPPSTSSTAPKRRLYRPSDSSTLRAKPSIVSPPSGTGISGSCIIAVPMSADCAVGRSTTSNTKAVQLSELPDSSAATTSARAVSARSTALTQDIGDRVGGKEPVYTVAAQQKAVVARHAAGWHSPGVPPSRRQVRGKGRSTSLGHPPARGRWLGRSDGHRSSR